MTEFITNVPATIAVSAVLAAAVIFACIKLYRDKRSGKSSCGGNCGSCPYSSECGKNSK